MNYLGVNIMILLAFITEINSAPADTNKYATINNYEFERGVSHDYKFGFQTSDGTTREEIGKSDQNNSLAVNGNISWVDQDGSVYEMYFKADKWGFRPIIKRISGP